MVRARSAHSRDGGAWYIYIHEIRLYIENWNQLGDLIVCHRGGRE